MSLFSIFGKIAEKFMYKRLYNFLEIHKILYNLQFGFHASHSVNHALISMTESIINSLDDRNLGVGSFLTCKALLIPLIIRSFLTT